jgi:hypothetical protein
MWEILFVPVLVGNNVLRNVALNYADVHRRTCNSSRGEPTLHGGAEMRASIAGCER